MRTRVLKKCRIILIPWSIVPFPAFFSSFVTNRSMFFYSMRNEHFLREDQDFVSFFESENGGFRVCVCVYVCRDNNAIIH